MFDTISNIITFINESPKRKALFHVNQISYSTTRFIHNVMMISSDFRGTLNMLVMVWKK